MTVEQEGISGPGPASTVRALGLHHTLKTAVADLIDNSVDAGAHRVLVRFLLSGWRIDGIRIIDDGAGMDESAIDGATQYGARRGYGSGDQGHFGVGLKAASLSQAEALAVYSAAEQHDSVGRRLAVTGKTDHPVVEVIGSGDARQAIESAHPRFPMTTGTIVEWRGIKTFPLSADREEQVAWLESTIGDLQSWLGLVFHRLLQRGLVISIDTFDEVEGRPGAPRSVRAIDPFGYRRSGLVDYPRELSVAVEREGAVVGHIWPARNSAPEYRLGGLPGRESQGFFVYRNDRILQAGGWLDVIRPRPELALARVAVEWVPGLAEHITINPEKSGVVLDATVSALLRQALNDGYLDDATRAAKAARKVQRRPITIVEPADGLPDEVLDEFADSFTFLDTADSVHIGWRVLAQDRFFEVDLETRSLWINARFRQRLGGTRRSGNDVPLLRTLVYLVAQDMFDAVRHSARQIDQMDAWQRVLMAAMVAGEGERGDEQRRGE